MSLRMILSPEPDPRFVTIRRGGTLTDTDHRLLALWAADCAAHVLHHFERARPGDDRPRHAIELARAWGRGEMSMKEVRKQACASAAARETCGAARFVALAAAQAVVVSHVPSHYLGAAAYAIRAARSAAPSAEQEGAGRRECAWQRARLPTHLFEAVLEDQRKRNPICWFAFSERGA